jgi:hypothetical protein
MIPTELNHKVNIVKQRVPKAPEKNRNMCIEMRIFLPTRTSNPFGKTYVNITNKNERMDVEIKQTLLPVLNKLSK